MNYREPPPHVHVYDRERYVPPHHFVPACRCGKRKPPPLWVRVLDRGIDAAVHAAGLALTVLRRD